jgi:hypothetical protein
MKPTMTNNFLAGATYVEGVVAGSKAQGLTLQDSASKKLGRCVRAQAGRSGTINIDGSLEVRNGSQTIRDLTQIESIGCDACNYFFLRWPRIKGGGGPALYPCRKISYFLPLGSMPARRTTILVFLFLWLAAEL